MPLQNMTREEALLFLWNCSSYEVNDYTNLWWRIRCQQHLSSDIKRLILNPWKKCCAALDRIIAQLEAVSYGQDINITQLNPIDRNELIRLQKEFLDCWIPSFFNTLTYQTDKKRMQAIDGSIYPCLIWLETLLQIKKMGGPFEYAQVEFKPPKVTQVSALQPISLMVPDVLLPPEDLAGYTKEKQKFKDTDRSLEIYIKRTEGMTEFHIPGQYRTQVQIIRRNAITRGLLMRILIPYSFGFETMKTDMIRIFRNELGKSILRIKTKQKEINMITKDTKSGSRGTAPDLADEIFMYMCRKKNLGTYEQAKLFCDPFENGFDQQLWRIKSWQKYFKKTVNKTRVQRPPIT